MNLKTRKDLFESHFHFWAIKLELDKKYKFILKQDNRMNAFASIEVKGKNTYEVKYNTKNLTAQYKIIHTLLHEIGHTFYDFRIKDDVMHEAGAEYFALSTIKKEMPKMYQKCVNWTKKLIAENREDETHRQGYIKALIKLGEMNEL